MHISNSFIGEGFTIAYPEIPSATIVQTPKELEMTRSVENGAVDPYAIYKPITDYNRVTVHMCYMY